MALIAVIVAIFKFYEKNCSKKEIYYFTLSINAFWGRVRTISPFLLGIMRYRIDTNKVIIDRIT
jgi:hypothetical protein